jgi:hypothetical protein
MLIKTREDSLKWYAQKNHKDHAGNPLASWISNSRYPSVIRASQTCEGFDFYGHNDTLQAISLYTSPKLM